jgi:Protein of unknown function (DUF3006).
MKLVVERFEGKYVLCEMEDKKIINIDRCVFPKEVKEGDVVDIQIKIDVEETLRIKSKINKLTKDLWV